MKIRTHQETTMTKLDPAAAENVHYATDPRIRHLAEAAWRMRTGGSRMDWLCLGKNNPEALISEAREWVRAAVAAGVLPPPSTDPDWKAAAHIAANADDTAKAQDGNDTGPQRSRATRLLDAVLHRGPGYDLTPGAAAQQPATETLRCACTHTRGIHTGPHLFCAVPGCECERYAGARQDGARP